MALTNIFTSKWNTITKDGATKYFLQQRRIVQPTEALQNHTIVWLKYAICNQFLVVKLDFF